MTITSFDHVWYMSVLFALFNNTGMNSVNNRWSHILTNHSLWPCRPSWFSLFTAITNPVPGLAALQLCWSTHPLKTQPNPPSPNTLSGRKFLVAVFRSLNPKLLRFDDSKISLSLRGVCGTEADESLLLESLPSLLTYLEFAPANKLS